MRTPSPVGYVKFVKSTLIIVGNTCGCIFYGFFRTTYDFAGNNIILDRYYIIITNVVQFSFIVIKNSIRIISRLNTIEIKIRTWDIQPLIVICGINIAAGLFEVIFVGTVTQFFPCMRSFSNAI